MSSSVFLNNILEQIQSIAPARIVGSVVRTEGTTIAAVGFPAPIGAIARVERSDESNELLAEVIGFRDNLTVLYSYSDLKGVRRGARIELSKTIPRLAVGDELLGRVLDAFGRTIDSGPAPVLPSRIRRRRPDPFPARNYVGSFDWRARYRRSSNVRSRQRLGSSGFGLLARADAWYDDALY